MQLQRSVIATLFYGAVNMVSTDLMLVKLEALPLKLAVKFIVEIKASVITRIVVKVSVSLI